MSRASYIVADVRAGLDAIEDGTVDLVLSSPGFLGLRAYLPAGHPLKHLEVGTESTPAAYIDSMLDITARLRAKLTRTGTMAIGEALLPAVVAEGRLHPAGNQATCLSTPEWCEANPLPGREDEARHTVLGADR